MPVTISGSTGITNVDGSAGTPAEKGATSSTAGVFFPAVDTVAISTASTERVRVGSAGQIGIAGANYGTSGQVLTSGGASAAPSWATPATPASGQFQSQLFTSSGTWTAPTGVTKVKAIVIGGGGGAYNGCPSFSGGAGGTAIGTYTVTPGTGYTVTVGSGGAVTVAGGSSSLGALLSATGGAGATSGGGGANGAGSSGTLRNTNSNQSTGGIGGNVSGNTDGAAINPWLISTTYVSGAFGRAGSNGGVGGLVYLEWVG